MAEAGEAFLAATLESPAADCLVRDVQMPGMNGLEVQKRLKQIGLDLPIIKRSAKTNRRQLQATINILSLLTIIP